MPSREGRRMGSESEPMKRLGHTGCSRGKRVLVILLSGRRIEDRFVRRTHTTIFLRTYGSIAKSRIRSFKILRGPEKAR